MKQEIKDIMQRLLKRHKELGITDQIDYEKFYLYSIITHSTAIEGSTVTEVEAQLLFDEGITAKGKPMIEQLMNLDLKTAYDYGRIWIKRHEDISVQSLVTLAAKVMARTGGEYNSLGGSFDASKGELRKLNNTSKLSLTQGKLRTQTSSSTVWRNCIANICNKISTSSLYRQTRKWSIKREFSKKWSISGR